MGGASGAPRLLAINFTSTKIKNNTNKHLKIRRAFGPRRGEITEINPLSFNPLRGFTPSYNPPQGGPGARSCCIVA